MTDNSNDVRNVTDADLDFEQYRKRPVVIDAVQLDEPFRVDTLEGDNQHGDAGDYLVEGVQGERYHVDAEIFEQTYESDDAVDHRPRRFELVRMDDYSGVSGTGVVAVGVAYPDGAVHMQWRNAENDDLETDSNGVAFKPAPDGIEATIEIHGHEGRTELRWIDK